MARCGSGSFVNFKFVLFLVVLCQFEIKVVSGGSGRIKLENGKYTGIVVGIDGGKISRNECTSLLGSLEMILVDFSSKLYQATEGRAQLGPVDILLPEHWSCIAPAPAPASYSYDKSAIQVTTSHPLAESLPWTRQYKPCGHEGDSIILPTSFLQGDTFTSQVKGQMLLHEFAKFRYGVFEEYGFLGKEDDNFSPCYTQNNQAQLTSCSGVKISTVASNKSECSMQLLKGQRESLIRQLNQSSSSIMASPFIENVLDFCNSTTHNQWANNKQNIFCMRKSVTEVVNSHVDFSSGAPPIQQRETPKIRFVRHVAKSVAAYAFVIEDSAVMSDKYKILHVKQAISQFVQMLEIRTTVIITTFSEDSAPESKTRQINSDEHRREILTYIPDVNGGKPGRVSQLAPVMQHLNDTLDSSATLEWNVILVTSTPNVTDMSLAIEIFGKTSHSISVLTFDTTSDWLLWNSIPNTRNVIVLPVCYVLVRPCSLQTSVFIMDELISILNDRQYFVRFVEKAASITVPNISGQSATFLLKAENEKVASVFFFVTSLRNHENPSGVIELSHTQSGTKCTATPLLGYGYVITFNRIECMYQSGEWKVATLNLPYGDIPMQLHTFVEHKNIEERLILTPSLGIVDPTQGIYPNNITSAFVSITTNAGEPVLAAQVVMQVYSSSQDGQRPMKVLSLTDDGNGADQTGNDGIYSGYLSGLSTSQSYHLLQLEVNTFDSSIVLEKIVSPNASMLDDRVVGKCCGKMIQPLKTRAATQLRIQMLHLGFKTLESIEEFQFPPETIASPITTKENTDNSIVFEFLSVRGDIADENVMIKSIQACCVTSNGSIASPAPTEANCKPDTTTCSEFQQPGKLQTCSMNKRTLVDIFLEGEDRFKYTRLGCALRVVNSNFVAGLLSRKIVDVDVSAVVVQMNTENECKTLSDKCLPILYFWIMIGGLALLLLLLILTLCCCWYRLRKKKGTTSYTKDTVDSPRRKNSPKSEVLSVHYQSSPKPPPKSPEAEPKFVRELFVNHAYIQDGDGEIKIITDNGQIMRKPKDNTGKLEYAGETRIPTSVSPVYKEERNMQIYKPVAPPRPKPSRPARSINPPQQQERPKIIHPNPNLRSDSSFMSPPPYQPPPPSSHPDPSVVYATISRSGRLKPIMSPSNRSSTLPKKQVSIDPHYMVPHNSIPVLQRDPAPVHPPPQVERYPSSDTDSSSGQLAAPGIQSNQHYPGRPRYNNPPPYPVGSQIFSGNPQPITFQSTLERTKQTPSPPLFLPPVPPPRFDRGGASQKSAVQHFSNKQDMSSDDDSDQWDDGDFEFNAGISYA